ncbi:MAG: ATP-binding protein, partial [Myxococcota bacterium]
ISATNSAADLVRQLLLVARNEPESRQTTVDLAMVVRDAVNIARQTFDRRIFLTLQTPNRPCWVRGRASHLQQVLLNLLINARDAVADATNPSIEVLLESAPCVVEDASVPGWRLSVTDNGAGMDANTLARLGEPFFSTKPQGRGTGLGVATGVSIAQDHGGALQWVSELQKGSTFTLSLPRVNALRPARPPAIPQTPDLPRRKRVLVIDDEVLVRRVLRRLLEKRSLDVTEAATGLEGIERFEAEREHLSAVLLDLSMPELSGAEVLPRLIGIDPTIPIVIMSGHIHQQLDLSAAFAIAQKPIAMNALFELLKRAFAARTSR